MLPSGEPLGATLACSTGFGTASGSTLRCDGWAGHEADQIIDLRPVYRRKEERIRAHVLLAGWPCC